MDAGHVAGSFVTLARLDALIATTISCLRLEGSDKVEDHWQKVFHDEFLSYFPLAYSQLVRSIRSFVKDRCPNEHELSSLSLGHPVSSRESPPTGATR